MEVRKYLKKIKDDGWYLHDTDGPTRQYVHKEHDGFLTICAKHNHVLGADTVAAALKPASVDTEGMPEVVVEITTSGVSAYCPHFPGVVATGEDEATTRSRISEAVALHRRALAGEAREA